MFKRACVVAVLALGFAVVGTSSAEAYIVRRVAPIRRAALPPYRVARRVVAGPVYGPVIRPVYAPVYSPVMVAPVYAAPVYYGGGVSVSVW
ncbi:hypothetical protein OAS39_03255 [Pirellulales bacterium]|nr:hypothetical protein [Pirellulales bacterium]